jgi:predicted secreted Zn-dependent protease
MAETLINISADTVDDFMDKASEKLGEDGELGDTDFEISAKPTLNAAGEVVKVKFELKVTIKRAHWSGGKADANNKKAIQAVEQLTKKHEEKHRKLAVDICAREFGKAEKALKGKSNDDVQDAIDAMTQKINDAYEDLDKKEGVASVTEKPDGSFTVKLVGR